MCKTMSDFQFPDPGALVSAAICNCKPGASAELKTMGTLALASVREVDASLHITQQNGLCALPFKVIRLTVSEFFTSNYFAT